MIRILTTLAVAALAGCASPPPRPHVLEPGTAQQMSAAQLCLGLSTFGPRSSVVASQEIERRHVDCRDHAQAAAQLQQAQEQQRAQMDGILLQNAMRPIPPIPPVQFTPMVIPQQQVCTSQWIGNQMQTVCR